MRFDQILELSAWLKQELRTAGHSIIPSEAPGSPAIITIALPRSISSEQLGMDLEEQGFLLNYKSRYLLSKNWVQICLMGETSREMVERRLGVLRSFAVAKPTS